FSIGTGSRTITPASELPHLTDAVTIDGTTQPGFGGSPLIVLRGASSGQAGYDGLTITAANCTVRGLVINRFNEGILIQGSAATGNVVAGNFLGTDLSGTTAQPNTFEGVASRAPPG